MQLFDFFPCIPEFAVNVPQIVAFIFSITSFYAHFSCRRSFFLVEDRVEDWCLRCGCLKRSLERLQLRDSLLWLHSRICGCPTGAYESFQ